MKISPKLQAGIYKVSGILVENAENRKVGKSETTIIVIKGSQKRLSFLYAILKKEGELMPTREEANETLCELIDSNILSDELTEKLEGIRQCISAEESHGIFVWGAESDDWMKLFVAYREDLLTDELKKELQSIYDKYKIKEEGE